jgi:hypothetical protein
MGGWRRSVVMRGSFLWWVVDEPPQGFSHGCRLSLEQLLGRWSVHDDQFDADPEGVGSGSPRSAGSVC